MALLAANQGGGTAAGRQLDIVVDPSWLPACCYSFLASPSCSYSTVGHTCGRYGH